MKRDKIFLQYFFCSGAWTIIRNKFIVSNTFFKYKITKQNIIISYGSYSYPYRNKKIETLNRNQTPKT